MQRIVDPGASQRNCRIFVAHLILVAFVHNWGFEKLSFWVNHIL